MHLRMYNRLKEEEKNLFDTTKSNVQIFGIVTRPSDEDAWTKKRTRRKKNSVMRSNENHGTKMTVSVLEKKTKKLFNRTKQNSIKFSACMPNSPKNATTIDLKSFVTSHDWNVCSSRFHCVTIMSFAWTKTSMPKIWTLFCFVPFF